MSPAAASLLDKLRGAGASRPQVDPELAGGLREWLEDSLSGPVSRLPVGDRALHVNSRVLAGFPNPRVGPTDAVALRALVKCLFRQWVTTGQIEDPVGDAVSGLAASGDHEAIDLASRMTDEERRPLTEAVRAHAAQITTTWPALSPAWYPRARERLTIPLCGGRVVLAGIADLVVGPPAASEASVCIVEVETEQRRTEHRSQLHFLALLETLRVGAAPSRVATYYTGTGELHAEPVDEHSLVRALLRTVSVVEGLCSREPYRESGWERSAVAATPAGASR